MNTGKKSYPYTVEELIDMINSSDKDAQKNAARRIWIDWSKLESRERLETIGFRLHDLLISTENTNVSSENREIWHFMIALGCLQYEDAVDNILSQLKNSPSENIRGFAAEALGKYDLEKLNSDTLETLWEVLTNDNALVVKINILRALEHYYRKSNNEDVANRLLGLLEEENHPVVLTTQIKVLGKIGSIDAVPHLIHYMVSRRKELNINAAALALDDIAELHGFETRKQLMDKYGFTTDDL